MNVPQSPTGGPYHPAIIYTFGETPGQQPIPMHHPGVSLRNEVALVIYRELVAICGAEYTPEGEGPTVHEAANVQATNAFIFADAFLKASRSAPKL